jgi:hypothetical protein
LDEAFALIGDCAFCIGQNVRGWKPFLITKKSSMLVERLNAFMCIVCDEECWHILVMRTLEEEAIIPK